MAQCFLAKSGDNIDEIKTDLVGKGKAFHVNQSSSYTVIHTLSKDTQFALGVQDGRYGISTNVRVDGVIVQPIWNDAGDLTSNVNKLLLFDKYPKGSVISISCDGGGGTYGTILEV